MAGINVGLHVEKKYNTHFDCFDFFNAKIVCVGKNFDNVVI